MTNFNSRPCERDDEVSPGRSATSSTGKESISIHAPARGTTPFEQAQRPRPWYFNSRPCERDDNSKIKYQHAATTFQFTPLREGRQQKYTILLHFFAENSKIYGEFYYISQLSKTCHIFMPSVIGKAEKRLNGIYHLFKDFWNFKNNGFGFRPVHYSINNISITIPCIFYEKAIIHFRLNIF